MSNDDSARCRNCNWTAEGPDVQAELDKHQDETGHEAYQLLIWRKHG